MAVRIRKLHRRESPVRSLLLLHHLHIHTKLFQDRTHRHVSASVKRCVGDLYLRGSEYLGPSQGCLDHIKVCPVDAFGNAFKNSLRPRFFLAYILYVRSFHAVCKLCNAHVVRRRDLPAVRPVDLVSIVFARVMRCSDYDSGGTLQMANCKGEHRNRMKRIIQVCLDPVGCQDKRCRERKLLRVMPRVVCDRDGRGFERRKVLTEPLCDLPNHERIDSVRASPDHTAHSRSPERKGCVEPLVKLVDVVLFNQILDFASKKVVLLILNVSSSLFQDLILLFYTDIHNLPLFLLQYTNHSPRRANKQEAGKPSPIFLHY